MNPENKIKKERKVVAGLIFEVLTEKTCVKEALKNFPQDIKDSSIKCAWHALVHFEADEEFRKNDIAYRDEQNDYLEMIAFSLKEGNSLPLNIINSYNEYYEDAFMPKSQGFLNQIKNLFRFTI
jgi:hypothetical protein